MTLRTTPVRFGLLGCGYIARKAVAPALVRSSAARFEAVGSSSLEKAHAFADEFQTRAVHGYERLVEDPDVDCVYIALPNALHFEWILRAAAAGKHVLCEKPAVLSLEDADRALEACAKHGVRLLEGYMFCFHPQHAKALELVQGGALGEVIHFESAFGFPPLERGNFRYVRSMGGGALNDAAGYSVRAARLLFGEDPTAAYARLVMPPSFEVDVRGSAMLEFPGGRSAHLAFGFNYYYRNTYSVWGSAGFLTLARAFSIPPDLPPPVTLTVHGASSPVEVESADHFQLMIDTFCRVLVQGGDGEQDFEVQLFRQARVMEALRRSAHENRVVRVVVV